MAVGLTLAGSRITAALVASVAPLCTIKGADQSVTSSVTLVNDTALVLPVVAGAAYLFDCFLDYEGGTLNASDLQWTWAVPSGATLRYLAVFENVSGATSAQVTRVGGSVAVAGTAGATNLQGATMKGSLIVSATAGSVQLRWAQNSSSATPTIVHAQSYLALWRIS